jgi:hypothetical protein
LRKLDQGDLIYEIDFRQVYATVLKNWLKAGDGIIDPKLIPLNFI